MRQLNLSEDNAYHLLNRRSRSLRKHMREVAQDVFAIDEAIRDRRPRK